MAGRAVFSGGQELAEHVLGGLGRQRLLASLPR